MLSFKLFATLPGRSILEELFLRIALAAGAIFFRIGPVNVQLGNTEKYCPVESNTEEINFNIVIFSD